MQNLAEDLIRTGCECILLKPWNMQNEAILRELCLNKRINEKNDDES
jgi:hypothetical protein